MFLFLLCNFFPSRSFLANHILVSSKVPLFFQLSSAWMECTQGLNFEPPTGQTGIWANYTGLRPHYLIDQEGKNTRNDPNALRPDIGTHEEIAFQRNEWKLPSCLECFSVQEGSCHCWRRELSSSCTGTSTATVVEISENPEAVRFYVISGIFVRINYDTLGFALVRFMNLLIFKLKTNCLEFLGLDSRRSEHKDRCWSSAYSWRCSRPLHRWLNGLHCVKILWIKARHVKLWKDVMYGIACHDDMMIT